VNTATDERRLVAEPIMAWKTATLTGTMWSDELAFKPLSAPGTYGTTEVAECRPVPGVTPGHRWMWSYDGKRGVDDGPPEHDAPHPDCACGFYATKDRTAPAVDVVALRVELTGTVIVHERGYRAQRQQVVAIEIPKMCRCGRKDVIGLLPMAPFRPLCPRCSDRIPVRPAVLSDVAGRLGLDVGWCEPVAGVDRWNRGGFVPSASVIGSFGVSFAQMQQAMQQAMQQTIQAMQSSAQLTKAMLDELLDDDEPVHPLEAKRRRDEARRQRLEQLAGPRRGPRNIAANRRR
jgi:hypothetical protein